MANKTKGEIDIDLGDGVERKWCLTLRGIAELENALSQLNGGKKQSWNEFCARGTSWDSGDYALVIWAGLYQRDKSITPEYILDNSTLITLQQFQLAFADLMNDGVPDRYKKKEASESQGEAKDSEAS